MSVRRLNSSSPTHFRYPQVLVLILALNLLLRPAQQYSSQPAVSHALSISTPRLTSLAKRWPNLRDYYLNLVDLVTEKGKAQAEALPTEAKEVNFVFYRQSTARRRKKRRRKRRRRRMCLIPPH